jgi:hypothetical protein
MAIFGCGEGMVIGISPPHPEYDSDVKHAEFSVQTSFLDESKK